MTTKEYKNDVPRITGLLIVEVRKSNPNGDPERESSPRQRPDGKGEISPVSVKRKLRDLVQEKEGVIWSEIKTKLELDHDDHFQILESRGRNRDEIKKQMEPKDGKIGQAFIDAYWDGRLFGNTFLEEGGADTIRAGVAHFGVGISLAPVEIEFSTWTSKSGVEKDKDRGMAPMAFRVVKHGLYAIPFFVNPNVAHKTGCTKRDVDLMLHLLKHIYSGTRSVVRSMVEVVHAHTFTHKSRAGSVSDFAFLDALTPKKLGDLSKPSESLTDYNIPTWDDIQNLEIRPGSEEIQRLLRGGWLSRLRDVSGSAVESEPLAHSARAGATEQTYREHVGNVLREAVRFASEAAELSPRWRESFVANVERAASYHDLGKLDALFQEVLRHNQKNKHRFNHVEAGTAHLLRLKQFEAAFTGYAHHIGLQSFPKEKAKFANGQNLVFRDVGELEGLDQAAWQRTDEYLENYLLDHHKLFAPVSPVANQPFTGLVRRLALSCLVDADHGDTARHYRNEREVAAPDLRSAERLARLDEYVAGLAAKIPPTNEREKQRLALRQEVYRACRSREVLDNERVFACDSPVGTGKTTAVMAHLLGVAAKRKLRRVFVVLPFTDIIDQSVDIYRRALRLADESEAAMASVVAAHHHRVDFSSYEARCLAARWDSPIVVTTAVQFFETLAARDTASLRKFHQVAGSGIFVDESHAAVPPALWPQMLRWLRELCEEWGCQLVLASGTLTRFWNRPGFMHETERREIPDLIDPQTRAETMKFEQRRVSIRTEPQALSVERLSRFIRDQPGPQLVIFNTVQSAAVFAHYLREDLQLGENVEHISTALTPRDRTKTVARVKQLLASERPDWILVATSCVEAGVDFSFRSAFRESWGLVNLLQIAGRASRSGEYDGAEVWDFRHDATGGLSLHPQAKLSRRILAQIFVECAQQNRQPGPDDCTDALQREIHQDHGEKALRMEEIFQAEKDADYPQVAKLCRVIDAATLTAVVDLEIIQRLENPDRSQWPGWREMMLGSVQLWLGKEKQFALPEITGLPSVFRWSLEYDPFLGYMAGVIPLLKTGREGLEVL